MKITFGFSFVRFISRTFFLRSSISGLYSARDSLSVIIGSSSHFEIAIATAISLYGLGSQAALGTTMGLFWEVPIMLGLVYLGKWLGSRGFWKSEKTTNLSLS